VDARYAVLIADQNRQVLEDLTQDDVIPEELWNGQHYLVGSAESEKDMILSREEFEAKFDILSSMIVHTIEKKTQ
jgi:hypothetical protein